MRLPASAFWLVAPAALAFWLLVATPSRWLGIDTGPLGATLMLAATWIGLWLASRIPDDAAAAASPGEQKRWVALAFTTAIGAVMLAQADVFAAAESTADLRDVGRPIGMLLVGWVIFSTILHQRIGARVQEDERDRAVEASADAWSHGALAISIIGIAVLFGFSPADRLRWATPIVIANLLMFALVVSCFVGGVVAVWRYRRDRA
jgi:hypothetical protein